MAEMIKLSIIIPVYNAAPYIARCLDSIVNSKEWETVHDSVEVIIIEDGSTDKTREALAPYIDLVGVRYTEHKTNWGVAMARNHGISLAFGEFVTFLDADDELAPHAIPFMLRHIDEDIQTPVVMFNHMRVYGNAAPVAKFTNRRGFYYFTRGDMPQKWTTVWGKMIRKSFLDENRIRFPEGIQYGEDELFLIECFKIAPRFYHVPEVAILKHNDNPESLTHTLTKKKLNDFMRAEIALIERDDNPPDFDAALRRVIAEHWSTSAFIGIYGR